MSDRDVIISRPVDNQDRTGRDTGNHLIRDDTPEISTSLDICEQQDKPREVVRENARETTSLHLIADQVGQLALNLIPDACCLLGSGYVEVCFRQSEIRNSHWCQHDLKGTRSRCRQPQDLRPYARHLRRRERGLRRSLQALRHRRARGAAARGSRAPRWPRWTARSRARARRARRRTRT